MPSQPTAASPACPICSKPEVERYRPFCSARCKEIDLGRWLKEAYRLPSEEPLDEQSLHLEDEERAGRE